MSADRLGAQQTAQVEAEDVGRSQPLTPVDEIAPRRLIPTPRQVAAGERQPEYAGAVLESEPQPGRGQRLRGFLAGYDLRKVSGPKTPIAVFLLLALVGQLTDLVFTITAPEVQATFAAAPAAILALAAAVQIVEYLVQPVYGWVVDRVSRVALLRISRVLGNPFYALSAFAGNVGAMIGLAGGGGLLGLGAQTPQATLMADYYDEEALGRIATLVPAVQSLATVVAPVLIGILVAATNWRIGVFVVGCIATAAGFSTFLLREPDRGAAERRQLGIKQAEPEQPLSFGESWRAAGSIHTLRRIWYATPFQVATGTLPTLSLLAFYFSGAYGLTDAERGLITGLMGLASLLGLLVVSPVAGRLLARVPGRLMSLASGLMVLRAASIALVAASPVLGLSVAFTVPLAIATAAVPPLTQVITLKVVPPRMRGLGLSTLGPWQLGGIILVTIAVASAQGAGARAMLLSLVPLHLIGAYFFATASTGVDRDMRAARSSVLADRAVREAREAGEAKLLVCRGVEVLYGSTQVLFGVDLDVRDGEVLALLGTNGAGKSTLLRAIAGVHNASNGAILLDGRDITHEPAHANARRGVVIMPGGRATFPTLTVAENLRAATWLYRDDDRHVKEQTEAVLGFFPMLRQRLDERAGNLSGGEQQMVGLGQAFLMRPRLLMIDELSLGLAPRVVEQLLRILGAIHAQGTTIVLVEQSVSLALRVAKRSVFMEKGVVRFDGPTEELLRQPDLIRSIYVGGALRARSLRVRERRPAARPQQAALEVRDVRLSFGGVQPLRGVSLQVSEGEVVGVIGPNGAGKTTLFDVISGLQAPDGGVIRFDGRDITRLSPDARSRLGLARSFQNVLLFPALTVRENIAVALDRLAVRSEVLGALWAPPVLRSEAKIARRVEGLVEMLGLGAFADKFLHELSTGSRRAVEIACMMAAEPKLLLLDEPSSGLAQAESEALGPVLLRLVRDTGCGLLLIEHDVPLAASMAQRFIAMDLGEVIADGTPQEVMTSERVQSSYLLPAAAGVSAPRTS